MKPTHLALKFIDQHGGFTHAGPQLYLVFIRNSDYFRGLVASAGHDRLDYLNMLARMRPAQPATTMEAA